MQLCSLQLMMMCKLGQILTVKYKELMVCAWNRIISILGRTGKFKELDQFTIFYLNLAAVVSHVHTCTSSVYVYMCVHVCVCVHMCVFVCVRMHVCVCAWGQTIQKWMIQFIIFKIATVDLGWDSEHLSTSCMETVTTMTHWLLLVFWKNIC